MGFRLNGKTDIVKNTQGISNVPSLPPLFNYLLAMGSDAQVMTADGLAARFDALNKTMTQMGNELDDAARRGGLFTSSVHALSSAGFGKETAATHAAEPMRLSVTNGEKKYFEEAVMPLLEFLGAKIISHKMETDYVFAQESRKNYYLIDMPRVDMRMDTAKFEGKIGVVLANYHQAQIDVQVKPGIVEAFIGMAGGVFAEITKGRGQDYLANAGGREFAFRQNGGGAAGVTTMMISAYHACPVLYAGMNSKMIVGLQ